MSLLREELEKHIRKLIQPLNEEELLIDVLKKRLTKKEYKLLNAMALELQEEEISELLGSDKERVQKLQAQLIKKINQEKLKQELTQ